jgi:opacity protein-like surface antigen
MRFANLFFAIVVALFAFNAQAHAVVSDDGCYEYDAQYFLKEKHTPIKKVEKEKATLIIDNSTMRTGYYMEIKSGMYQPLKLTKDFVSFKKRRTAPTFEARGGYNFGDYAVDAAVAYGSKSALILEETSPHLVPPAYLVYQNYSNSHKTKAKFLSFTLNGYYNILHYNGFTPYIGGGVGMTRNTLSDINIFTQVSNTASIRKGRTVTNLTWQLMLGARMSMTRDIELSAEYKYMDLGKIRSGTQMIYATTTTTEPADLSRLKVSSYLVGLRYYF